MERSDYICPSCGGELIYEKYKEVHLWVCSDCPLITFEYYNRDDVEQLSERLEYGAQQEFNFGDEDV